MQAVDEVHEIDDNHPLMTLGFGTDCGVHPVEALPMPVMSSVRARTARETRRTITRGCSIPSRDPILYGRALAGTGGPPDEPSRSSSPITTATLPRVKGRQDCYRRRSHGSAGGGAFTSHGRS